MTLKEGDKNALDDYDPNMGDKKTSAFNYQSEHLANFIEGNNANLNEEDDNIEENLMYLNNESLDNMLLDTYKGRETDSQHQMDTPNRYSFVNCEYMQDTASSKHAQAAMAAESRGGSSSRQSTRRSITSVSSSSQHHAKKEKPSNRANSKSNEKFSVDFLNDTSIDEILLIADDSGTFKNGKLEAKLNNNQTWVMPKNKSN